MSDAIHDEMSRQIAALRGKNDRLLGQLVEVGRRAQKGLVTLEKRHRAELAGRDATIMRLRAAMKLTSGTKVEP